MDILCNLPNWRRKPATGLVTVLVAMEDPAARRAMRQAIGRSISANIIEVDGKSGFHRAVTFQEIDLIVTDAEMDGCHSFDIIEQIRYGRLHCHAFPVVVMLCDHLNDPCIARVIDCGADLVLQSDTAVRAIPAQLEKLVSGRKPFIVTPHYIGPERREEDRGESSVIHMTVPNPLAARIAGIAPEDYRRQISLATHSISLMRRSLYVVRLEPAPMVRFNRTVV